MTGPHPAVAATRVHVRAMLHELSQDLPGGQPPLVLVGCSGGADSLALAAATAFEAPRRGWRAGAVLIDHGLQDGSARVTERAAQQCRDLGMNPVETRRVQVGDAPGGPEAAARTARYAAFEAVAAASGAAALLLAHTQSDQAEQVLLGLVRGSGARSLAGMPARRGLYARPFLDLPAATTRTACAEQGLEPWEDPHNTDERYRRVRARRIVTDLEGDLGPGVIAGLARSARLLRADADHLDAAAQTAADALGEHPWDAERLAALPEAVRTRTWRALLTRAGVAPGALTSAHVERLEDLLHRWRGQDGVHLPGAVIVTRDRGRIGVRAAESHVD